MCGRVRLSSEFSQIRIRLNLDDIFAPPNFPPKWNVPPTADMLTVVKDHERGPKPMMTRWASPIGRRTRRSFSTFNARGDGVETKAEFKGAWKPGSDASSSRMDTMNGVSPTSIPSRYA
jgi:putative SOS response-associated peptidase YedK